MNRTISSMIILACIVTLGTGCSKKKDRTQDADDQAASQADLVVSSFTVWPAEPTVRDTVVLTALIASEGADSTGECSAEITVGDEESGETIAVPALSPGVVHEIARRVVLPAAPAVLAKVVVDKGGAIDELSEDNNEASLEFGVTEPPATEQKLADLTITSFTAAPSRPTTKDRVTLTAVVKNTGSKRSGAGKVVIDMPGEATAPAVLALPALPAGGSKTLAWRTALAEAKTWEARAVADFDNVVAEVNETNNERSLRIVVSAAPQPEKPDLQVAKVLISPARPKAGDIAIVRAIVKNAGPGAAPACRAVIRIGVERNVTPLPVRALAAGAQTTIVRRKQMAAAGRQVAAVIADYGNAIPEVNESNNTGGTRFIVAAAPAVKKADLVVSSVTFTPSVPRTTDNITFRVTVQNRGPGAAGAFQVGIKVGGESKPRSYRVSGLAAGASTTLRRAQKLSRPARYIVKATADLTDAVAEQNEANNALNRSFSVLKPAGVLKPALVFQGFKIDTVRGVVFTRYRLSISNWAQFSNDLFKAAPELPPCGANRNAARSWVSVHESKTHKQLQSFCAFKSNTSLKSFWFSVRKGQAAPKSVYVRIHDRKRNVRYTSNAVVPVMLTKPIRVLPVLRTTAPR